ncbi:MAG: Clp protease N-terminal domain-containing protein, partial [Candidatus Methylacidiphilales bacterium]|nr:Clp protease N-terminal domain-containing protein [Candidatus Methylacidiphilales bacterium]
EASALKHSSITLEHLLLAMIPQYWEKSLLLDMSMRVSLADMRRDILREMRPNFDTSALDVLERAHQLAHHFHNNHVGAEHLLLALSQPAENVAIEALQHLRVDLEKLRQMIETETKRSNPDLHNSGVLPQTAAVGNILFLAGDEAYEMGHFSVRAEHLLLALLRAGGYAANVLSRFYVNEEIARTEILRRQQVRGILQAAPASEPEREPSPRTVQCRGRRKLEILEASAHLGMVLDDYLELLYKQHFKSLKSEA